MKLLNVIFLSTGLMLGAFKIAAEEPIQPIKTPDSKPEPKPAEGPKKDPFSPSALMRMRAQKPVEEIAPSAPPVGAVAHALPTFEGVLVKNNSVLASFKIGNKSIVIEPRNTFVADDVSYTFVGYANEVATLRDDDGRIHDLRIIQRASSTPPRTPDPDSNTKQ